MSAAELTVRLIGRRFSSHFAQTLPDVEEKVFKHLPKFKNGQPFNNKEDDVGLKVDWNSQIDDAKKTSPSSAVKLVPLQLHEHLFGRGSYTEEMRRQMEDGNCKENKLELPQLKSTNLSRHFELLGEEQFSRYKELLGQAMRMSLPEMPLEWQIKEGWTVYNDSGEHHSIPFPAEDLLFFDVEVCMTDGKVPVMAVAVSPTNWYSWCSARLLDESVEMPEFIRLEQMIPLGLSGKDKDGKRLVIGHNVAFDRQFVREQYLQKESLMRFWCTMSMHIACAGMADHQRNLFDKSQLNGRDFLLGYITEEDDHGITQFTPQFKELLEGWKGRTCKNSLDAVHRKYCDKENPLDKQWQSFFMKKSIEEVRENSQVLIKYCAADVRATFEVFQKLLPRFEERFPHPITYCGMMEMANAYLPITGNWRRFFDRCEDISSESKDKAAKELVGIARQIIVDLDKEDENGVKKYETDPWMWVSDWTRPAKRPEWPTWYWDLFQKKADALTHLKELKAEAIKMLCRQIPRMFGLCYGPYPLIFKPKFGWGFLVPSDNFLEEDLPEFEEISLVEGELVKLPVKAIFTIIEQNKISINDVISSKSKSPCNIGKSFNFYRLPHPSGSALNVGTPFAKSSKMNFDNFEEEVISPTRYPDILENFLKTRSTTRFWGNYRKRYQEQLPVWLDEGGELGAIVPAVCPASTVTRRAVHKLWLVTTNPKKDVIGSEMKSMVQCTKGWNLVGADVDSQEQWIAALFGDSLHEDRRAGATAFSNMLLAGSKTAQTDLHSVVAKEVGITRDQAKVLNYARLYGSGTKHAKLFLNAQGISLKTAKQLAKKLFSKTTGSVDKHLELNASGFKLFQEFLINQPKRTNNKIRYLVIEGRCFIESETTARYFEDWLTARGMCIDDAIAFRTTIKLYRDGYESHTFNFLTLRSNELHPKTPILKCRLSQALEPFDTSNEESKLEAHTFNQMYKRTIINWFVQSSAVDFLHMLFVCMRWLCQEYEIPARFVISIHDELRYLVPEKDKYRCALALTLSNMYVRAAISEMLGIRELPMSVAFFSQVDIDTVLRKEVNIECQMPDDKQVGKGEALGIEEIIEKTGGSLLKQNNL